MQREQAAGLRPEDFDQSASSGDEEEGGRGGGRASDDSEASSSEDDDSNAEPGTLGAAAKRAQAAAASKSKRTANGKAARGRRAMAELALEGGLALGGGEVTVERVERDLDGLSAEQKLEAVMSDAPELLALIGELRSGLAEVRSRVGPLFKEVRGNNHQWRLALALALALGLKRRAVVHLTHLTWRIFKAMHSPFIFSTVTRCSLFFIGFHQHCAGQGGQACDG